MIYLCRYTPGGRSSNVAKEHELGRKLLGFGLSKEYGLSLEQARLVMGSYGKPYLRDYPGIYFNISHTKGLVVCAISDHNTGIDVELVRPYQKRLAQRVLSKQEQQKLEGDFSFFQYWTLKESYVKTIGTGLAVPLKEVEFRWDSHGEIVCSKKGFHFYQSSLWNRYLLSICVESKQCGKEREEENMTYETLFEEIKTIFMKAEVSEVKEHLAYQFNIQGEAEGVFYAEVKDGELSIEPYEYYDRDVIFTCTGETLLKIANGKMDPVAAFTLGKLKVEGSIEKALRISEFIK